MGTKVDQIMIVGDWHGNTPWALGVIKVAQKHSMRKIISCGDFGIWTHREDGITYLDAMNAQLREQGTKLYFVGGNHENWDHLLWHEEHSPRTYQGHVIIRSHIFFIPNGMFWKWNDKTFMGVGGAVSVDKDYRLAIEKEPRTLWWPQEQLDDRVIDLIESKVKVTNLKVDYLITHDCPTNAPFWGRLKPDIESQYHRQKMDRLGRIVKPKWWFHGHMHDRYVYDFPMYEPTTQVRGLENDGRQWNWLVLDTVNDTVTWNQHYVRGLRGEPGHTE